MKIVIGTRTWLGSDWHHVDADPRPLVDEHGGRHPVDTVCDAQVIPLPDACAELVYSQECIEHVPWASYQTYLAEWARLVGRGGLFKIETPDSLAAYRQVLEADSLDMDRRINQIIYGGQSNSFDYHKVGLTPRMLVEDFTNLGLEIVEVSRGWEVGYLRVVGRRP